MINGVYILSLFPKLVSVWLKFPHKDIHRNFHHVFPASAQFSNFPIVNPSDSSKICRFCTVETMIKTSMVAIWESDHKFSSFLGDLQGRGCIIFPNYKASQIANTVKIYFLFKKRQKKCYHVQAILVLKKCPQILHLIL